MTNDLNKSLEALKTDLINSLQSKGVTVSADTVNEIKIIQDGNNLQLQVPGYLYILETGRKPTSKNPVAGNPPMIVRIQQWCAEKGIPAKAAWAIKKKIDKMGYPAKPGIMSEPLGDDNINARLMPSLQNIADAITTEILNAIHI